MVEKLGAPQQQPLSTSSDVLTDAGGGASAAVGVVVQPQNIRNLAIIAHVGK